MSWNSTRYQVSNEVWEDPIVMGNETWASRSVGTGNWWPQVADEGVSGATYLVDENGNRIVTGGGDNIVI